MPRWSFFLSLFLSGAIACGCGGEDSYDPLSLESGDKADTLGLALTFDYPYSEPVRLYFLCENEAGCDLQISACTSPRVMGDMNWLLELFVDQEQQSTVAFALAYHGLLDRAACKAVSRAGQSGEQTISVSAAPATERSCGHYFEQYQPQGCYALEVSLQDKASSFIKRLYGESVEVELEVALTSAPPPGPRQIFQPVLLSAGLTSSQTPATRLAEGSHLAGTKLPSESNLKLSYNPSWDLNSLGRLEQGQLLGQAVEIGLLDANGQQMGSCRGIVQAEHLNQGTITLGQPECSGAVSWMTIALFKLAPTS